MSDVLINVDRSVGSNCLSGFKIEFHFEPQKAEFHSRPLTKIKPDWALSYEGMNINHVSIKNSIGDFKQSEVSADDYLVGGRLSESNAYSINLKTPPKLTLPIKHTHNSCVSYGFNIRSRPINNNP